MFIQKLNTTLRHSLSLNKIIAVFFLPRFSSACAIALFAGTYKSHASKDFEMCIKGHGTDISI